MTRSRTLRGVVLAVATASALAACSSRPGAAAVVGVGHDHPEHAGRRRRGFVCCAGSVGRERPAAGPGQPGRPSGALDVLVNSALSNQFADSLDATPDQAQVSAAIAANQTTIDALRADQRAEFRTILTDYVEGQLAADQDRHHGTGRGRDHQPHPAAGRRCGHQAARRLGGQERRGHHRPALRQLREGRLGSDQRLTVRPGLLRRQGRGQGNPRHRLDLLAARQPEVQLTLLLTSPRVAPGLMSWGAWSAVAAASARLALLGRCAALARRARRRALRRGPAGTRRCPTSSSLRAQVTSSGWPPTRRPTWLPAQLAAVLARRSRRPRGPRGRGAARLLRRAGRPAAGPRHRDGPAAQRVPLGPRADPPLAGAYLLEETYETLEAIETGEHCARPARGARRPAAAGGLPRPRRRRGRRPAASPSMTWPAASSTSSSTGTRTCSPASTSRTPTRSNRNWEALEAGRRRSRVLGPGRRAGRAARAGSGRQGVARATAGVPVARPATVPLGEAACWTSIGCGRCEPARRRGDAEQALREAAVVVASPTRRRPGRGGRPAPRGRAAPSGPPGADRVRPFIRALCTSRRHLDPGALPWPPSRPSAPARSSTPAATPPSRSRSLLDDGTFGRAAVPRAPRPAPSRPSSCATAATATAARASEGRGRGPRGRSAPSCSASTPTSSGWSTRR